MSFLTAGETEVRAWTVPIGSTAVKAAGAIHSDFEKKFIRAEVVNWKALVDLGGYPGVREKGLAAPGRQGIHRQGWRRAGDPARVRCCMKSISRRGFLASAAAAATVRERQAL